MASGYALKVENLTKEFVLPHQRVSTIKTKVVSLFRKYDVEKQVAISGISFEVKSGEFFGIVGRNGSGKSTLLKCIAGIYAPNQGTVHVNGKLVPFIELGVGFNPDLSGRDNVFLNGALMGFSQSQVEAMYNDIVAFAELEDFMDQKLKNYSSGMQVRLAFSIAIRAQGDILLLDEVLAVGDSAFQRKCLNYFREVKKTDKTIILVSHSMQTIEEFCDRALMLEDSKIVAVGDPLKISAEYEMANSVFANKKLSKSPKEAKAKLKIRPRNPDVYIKKVSVSSGRAKTTKFSLADDVYVEVEVEVRKKLAFMLSAVLNNMDGEYVAGVNTQNNIKKLVLPAGNHKLVCKIAAGQFPNGPYRLTVNAITDTDSPELIDVASHDFGVKLPTITFTEKSLTKKGKFYMDAEWQLKD